MKPESKTVTSQGFSGTRIEELDQWDPYLVTIVNNCQDAAGIRRSENISVVVDELDSTAVRRRAALLRSNGSN